jgi:hypothetical protein
VHHSTFHTENSTRCNNVSKFITPYLYEAQHFLGNTPPETCWASYKYGVINFDTLLHLVGFSVWIVLWCTDPQTSNILMWFLMHRSTNIKYFNVISDIHRWYTHVATYCVTIPTQRTQISGRNSNSTKHSGGPPEDGREKRPELVEVLYYTLLYYAIF